MRSEILAWLETAATYFCVNGACGIWLRTNEIVQALNGSGLEITRAATTEAAAHQALGRRLSRVFGTEDVVETGAYLCRRRQEKDQKTRSKCMIYQFETKGEGAANPQQQ